MMRWERRGAARRRRRAGRAHSTPDPRRFVRSVWYGMEVTPLARIVFSRYVSSNIRCLISSIALADSRSQSAIPTKRVRRGGSPALRLRQAQRRRRGWLFTSALRAVRGPLRVLCAHIIHSMAPAIAGQVNAEDSQLLHRDQLCESVSNARIAYVLSANPFVQDCNYPEKPMQNGNKIPAISVIPIHLRMVAALRLRLLALLICMPNDMIKSEVPGYRQFGRRIPKGLPIEVLQVQNNSLGSYGMFLHAFATTRGRFDYYIMAEEDYVPSNPYVTDELVRMYQLAFPGKTSGMLAGLLQGRPVERSSRYPLHAEGSHIMSASSLEKLFDYTYNKVGWKGSMAARMLFLRNKSWVSPCWYFSDIQLGFGLLLADAGIESRDW
eukprot:6195475-Pleurochrysis_carterae.AAC.1